MKEIMQENHLLEPIEELLELSTSPLSEYQLMKALEAQGWLEPTDAGNSLALFGVHFLIYNALYQLHARYAQQGERYLMISALAIELVEVNDVQAKQELMDADQASQSELTELAAYYLDWDNLNQATQASVDELLSSFWSRYVSDDDYSQALNCLGVDAATPLEEVKKRYRQLLMSHHPDRGGDSEVFCQIHDAFSLIRRRHADI